MNLLKSMVNNFLDQRSPPNIAGLTERKDVRALMELLGYTSSKWDYYQVRAMAIAALGEVGDESVIATLLANKNPSRRLASDLPHEVRTAQAVNTILDRTLRRELVEASAQGRTEQVKALARQLIQYKGEIECRLARLSEEQAQSTLLTTYAICASLGDRAAIASLRSALTHRLKPIRQGAALFVQRLGLSDVASQVILLVDSGRAAECAALGPEAAPHIVQTLEHADANTARALLDALNAVSGAQGIRDGVIAWLKKRHFAPEVIEHALQLAGGVETIADAALTNALVAALVREYDARRPLLAPVLTSIARARADLLTQCLDAVQPDPKSLRFEQPPPKVEVARILEEAAWRPGPDRAGVLFLEALGREAEIPTLGEGALAALTGVLTDRRYFYRWGLIRALRAFGEPGGRVLIRSVERILDDGDDYTSTMREALALLEGAANGRIKERVIDLIFAKPKSFVKLYVPDLFGAFTELLRDIVRTFEPITAREDVGAFDNDGYYAEFRYDTEPMKRVLDRLRASANPVALNLLHKMATFPEVMVYFTGTDRAACAEGEIKDVVSLRGQAQAELQRRGNPPYSPEAYADDRNFAAV